MTGEPASEIQKYSRRRRPLTSDTVASEALEQMHTFAHRALLLSLGCALLLALASTRAGAASAKTSATISARLTATEFVASQKRSIKLIYKLPAPSKSFTYKLSVKRGSHWLLVAGARKKGSSKSQKRLSVGALFGGRTVKVGSYRVQLSCAGAKKSLSFRISPFAGYLTKKSFTVAEARSIKLTYAFSKPSKSFAYQLALKQGTKLQVLKKAKTVKKTKKLYLIGVRTASLKSLFGSKAIVVGSYQLKISSAYSTRKLNFKVVKSATPAATTGGSGSGTGSGNGSTGGADFTISGGVGGLEPGLTLPVALTLTNPNNTKIYVTRLTVSMSADSTPAGCSRDANFVITQSSATDSNSIAVPARGKVTLTSAPLAPQISFRNLSTSQDVCKNKSFALTFSGIAHS
ncbi:MAG TPA: hypothetical protein VIK32_08365 [Candidatus Limnocylindrales bacterium]